MLYEGQNSCVGIEEQKKLLTELLLQGNQAQIYPSSLAQQRLWFVDQLCHGSAAYNVHIGLWLYGTINMPALQSSLQEVVNRHETLRTCFKLERGDLLQVVDQSCPGSLSMTDFAGVAEPYPPTYKHAKHDGETPLDIGHSPLFTARVLPNNVEEPFLL